MAVGARQSAVGFAHALSAQGFVLGQHLGRASFELGQAGSDLAHN